MQLRSNRSHRLRFRNPEMVGKSHEQGVRPCRERIESIENVHNAPKASFTQGRHIVDVSEELENEQDDL